MPTETCYIQLAVHFRTNNAIKQQQQYDNYKP